MRVINQTRKEDESMNRDFMTISIFFWPCCVFFVLLSLLLDRICTDLQSDHRYISILDCQVQDDLLPLTSLVRALKPDSLVYAPQLLLYSGEIKGRREKKLVGTHVAIVAFHRPPCRGCRCRLVQTCGRTARALEQKEK
jgi:hypothetical protein